MKDLIIPDLHLDLVWDGLNRSEDAWNFISGVQSEQVDRVIWLGDIFDSPNVSHNTVARFMEALKLFQKPHIILRGNHDGLFKTKKGSPLEEVHASGLAYVVDKPEVIDGMLFLPYTDDKTVIEGKFKYGFSHLDIAEAVPGIEAEISRSSKCQIPQWAKDNCECIISGHIHVPQVIKNILILGSVLKVSITEAKDNKQYAILDNGEIELKPIKTRDIKDFRITVDELFKPDSIVVGKEDIVSVKLTIPHNIAHKFDLRALEKRVRESCYHLRFDTDIVKEKFIRNKTINTTASDLDIFSSYVISQSLQKPELIIEDFKEILDDSKN